MDLDTRDTRIDLETRLKNRIDELKKENASFEQERISIDQKQKKNDGLIEEFMRILKGEESKSSGRHIIKISRRTKLPVVTPELPFKKPKGKAILDILAENPNQYYGVTDLANELERRGQKTDAIDFKQSVRTTLNGLRRDGKIDFKTEYGGVKMYKAKK